MAFCSIQNIIKCFFLAFFAKKKHMKKGRFVDKNHGLTPLENVDFFRLCENFTFEVQKTLFSIQNIKKFFFLPFLLKRNLIRIRSIFWQKKNMKKGRFFDKNYGLTPFQNVDFFRLCENFTFKVQKALFSNQNIKKCFFLAFVA